MKKERFTKWLPIFMLVAAAIVLFKALDYLDVVFAFVGKVFSLLSPFFAGFLIAYLLYLPTNALEKALCKKQYRKWARSASVLAVYVLCAAAIAVLLWLVTPTLVSSAIDLFTKLPGYIENGWSLLNEHVPEISSYLTRGNIERFFTGSEWQELVSNVSQYSKGVIGVFSWTVSMFMAIIASVYMLLRRQRLLTLASRLGRLFLSDEVFDAVRDYISKGNAIFLKFLYAQFIDALVMALLVSITLMLFNVKYGILLGIMIGFMNFIPYFGAIIGWIVMFIVTALTGGLPLAALSGATVLVIQQIDANVINPRIIGNNLKISPLLVILAVTLGGGLFGVLGMFLAVPIVALIKMIATDYLKRLESKKKARPAPEES